MWERIAVMVRKEFRQLFREKRIRVIVIVPPLLQLIVFGFAVNLDVEHAALAWIDQDRTPASRELLEGFVGSGRFALMDGGKVSCAVHVSKGFARDLERGGTGAVQILVDGSNSNNASILVGYASAIVNRFARQARGGAAAAGAPRVTAAGAPRVTAAGAGVPRVTAVSRAWFNETLRSRNYFVPGVIVNIMTIVTLMLTAMAIVREKEIGTMEQLMVTPIRPLELMLGKMLPFAVVGMLDMALVTGAALAIFDIPFRGSLGLLVLCAAIFLLTTLGAGLFLSTISSTQQQAIMGSFFFFIPAFMLSGFAFPIRNMPEVIQWLTYINPLRYFVTILRGVFLKGAGADVLWPHMAALFGLGLAVLAFSALRFRKRLD